MAERIYRLATSLLIAVTTLTVVTTLAQSDEDFNNPTYGATRLNFAMEPPEPDVSIVSTLTCSDLGSRCVFRKGYYKEVDFGEGQETVNPQGAVWAYTVAGTTLTLGACTGDTTNSNDCIATCNANCTCMVESISEGATTPAADQANGTSLTAVARAASVRPCTTIATRAPTVSPKTDPPLKQVCPKSQFTTHCPTLMASLPPGISGNYDCFNFCGGAWVSNCEFSGQCGSLDCANMTAVGTVYGQVFGCSKDDLVVANADTFSNKTTSHAASFPTLQWSMLGMTFVSFLSLK